MNRKNVLAADFGASNGRVMLGNFDGNRLSIQEIHHLPNNPAILNGTVYWDFLRLSYGVKQELIKAKKYGKINNIGVDTQGMDLGLIDKEENPLENPVHYRDTRTVRMLGKNFGKVNKDRFYQITGSQFMEINTVFQLLALLERRPGLLKRVSRLLLMPSSFNYYLCGAQVSEYPIVPTTQMLDTRTKMWSKEVLESLDISERILGDIVPCGTRLGSMKNRICQELGVEPMEVIAMAERSTQNAFTAVSTRDKDFIFISYGTWSLFGTELNEPVINGVSERPNITNEGGCQGKISFLKSIVGLWLIQEGRRRWIHEGKEYNFGYLKQVATGAGPFKALIDPDAPEFVPAGDIPERIQSYCRKSGQKAPENEMELMRCIDENLALKYRMTLEGIRICTGREYSTTHMVGGGTQSGLLCQMTANACHYPVIAGSMEVTALGNAAMQLFATGELRDLDQVRSVVEASARVNIYEPKSIDQWEQVYG